MSQRSALDLAAALGHEELVFVQDGSSGLRAVIAIHDTSLGPAVGGTRMRPYASLDEAAVDALRLSRAMTWKAALAGMNWGGGKGVILGNPARDKSRALLTAYARALDRLGGRFHTGCDMGIEGRDAAVLARLTKHVSHARPGSRLETADLAALGVLESIRSVAALLELPLEGIRVAVQGLGQVGLRLARRLAAEGVRLTVADPDPGRVERAVAELGVTPTDPAAIYDAEVEIFSPNAMGGVLDDETLPRLRCRAVVGAANEPLGEERHAEELAARGILYAPDYLVNAGGLLSLLHETGEVDEEGVLARVRGIGSLLTEIVGVARTEGVPPLAVADRRARERLDAARERKTRGIP